MSATTYNNFVHFTPRSLFFTVLLIAVLTLPLWAFKYRQNKTPGLAGEWVGTIHVSNHISGVGQSEPVNADGDIYLKLEVYDGFLNRYRGTGQLTFAGSGQRNFHIDNLSLPNNGPRISGVLSGDLEASGQKSMNDVGRDFQGSATPDSLQFHTIDDGVTRGYVFTADLHRGTIADYRNVQK